MPKFVYMGMIGGIFLFVVSSLFSFAPKEVFSAGTPCHLYTVQSVPQGYGAWYDVFAVNRPIRITVDCLSSTKVDIRVEKGTGDFTKRYTYAKGWMYRNNTWQEITFLPTAAGVPLIDGAWYESDVVYTAALSQAEIAKPMYVIAYQCSLRAGIWQCGCRDAVCKDHFWQLQAFRTSSQQTTPPPGDTGGGSDTVSPAVPTGVSAVALSSSRIDISWKASTDNVGVTKYGVERCQGSGCTAFTQIATPVGVTYSNTGLAAGTTYRYRVRAFDAAGNTSAFSAIQDAITEPQAPSATELFNANLGEVGKLWIAHRPYKPSSPIYGPVGEGAGTARWHIAQWSSSVELPAVANNLGSASDGIWQVESKKSFLASSPQIRVKAVPQGSGTAFQLTADTTGLNFISCKVSDELDLLLEPNMPEFIPSSYPMGLIPTLDRPTLGAAGTYKTTFSQKLISGSHQNDGSCAAGLNVYSTLAAISWKNIKTGKNFQYQIVTFDSRGDYSPASGFWFDKDGSDGYCGMNDDVVSYGKTHIAPGGSSVTYTLAIGPRIKNAIAHAPSGCYPTAADKDPANWRPINYYTGSYINGKAKGEVEITGARLFVE